MNTPPDPPTAPDPLAVALAKLDPAPHGFEWNGLMFAAGRASKARAVAFWQAVAGTCALAAGGFAFAYFARPTSVTERERIVYVDRTPAHAPAVPPAGPPGFGPGPVASPNARPERTPQPSAGPEPYRWPFDPAPPQGAAAKWLATRNEILSVGLSALPDRGPTVSAPNPEK